MKFSASKTILRGGVAILALLASAAAQAQTRSFDVPAEEAVNSIPEFARQAGIQIVAPADRLEGVKTPAIKGNLELHAALTQLLAGTGFTIVSDTGQTIMLKAALKNVQAASDEAAQSKNVESVVVTGTLIRGVSPAAPVTTYTRDDIERTGASTIQDFSRRIPQNFSNTVPDAAGAVSASGLTSSGSTSDTRGAAFNLRGLGPTSTLTLVNGHRLAGAGTGGGFVDVSLIPLAAVDRVDVLTDGDSALYGSDAIGGVVNIALRQNYDGAETSLRYGNATEGAGQELSASQLAGTSWGSGGVFGAYEYRNQREIPWSARSFLPTAQNVWETPREESNKVFVAAHQEINPSVVLSAEGLFGARTVLSFNNRLVSPLSTGAQTLSSNEYSGSLSADIDVGYGWHWRTTAGHSQTTEISDQLITTVSTGAKTVIHQDERNKLTNIETKADGPLLSLPGGEMRGAISAEYLDSQNRLFNFISANVVQPNRAAGRDEFGLAGELYIPLIGDGNAAAAVQKLVLSLAGRIDHYSDAGFTANPRIGLSWSPVSDLDVRGSWSTSFHAPTLNWLVPNKLYAVVKDPDPTSATGSTLVIEDRSTGTVGLKPETAESVAFGFDWHPADIVGLHITSNYFNISYKNRISLIPFPGNDDTQIFQPAAANLQFLVTRNPSLALVQSYLSCTNCTILGLSTTPAANIGAILDDRTRNLASSNEDGFDFSADYLIPIAMGSISVGVNGTKIFNNQLTLVAGSAPLDLLDKYSQPVDLRLTGSLGWQYDGFSANLLLNYVGPYTNDRLTPAQPISDWTTVDLSLAYRAGDDTPLRGTTLSLAIQNLTDEHPPFAQAAFNTQVNYDPANATAIGRFISVQLRHEW